MLVCLIDVCSLLIVEIVDRLGLLLEIFKVISDISIYVELVEIDIEVNFLIRIFVNVIS